jgi:signal transduction histidine kinase
MIDHHERRSEDHDDDDDKDDDNKDDDNKDDDEIQIKRPPGLNLSMQLADQVWINAVYRVSAQPGVWAYATLLSLVLMGLAVCAVTFLMVRRITRPLATLAAASDALGRGEDGPDLDPTGPVEIRSTMQAFNQMRDRLHRFVDDRTNMLAAISHDLRTPLTSLRLRAEMIDDSQTREKILESLIEMQAMAEATLSFAKDDANKEKTRDTHIKALIDSIAADLQDLGQDVSVAVAPGTPENLSYRCRLFALKRAIRNLIENAVRYGERARVTLTQTDSTITITIEDDGPGIPEDNLGRVFEPFVRLENSRNTETGGIGLGLAIARNIIHAHGGEIHLKNNTDKGLCVRVTLPQSPEE